MSHDVCVYLYGLLHMMAMLYGISVLCLIWSKLYVGREAIGKLYDGE